MARLRYAADPSDRKAEGQEHRVPGVAARIPAFTRVMMNAP
jgi:hypothetical protein